jgi:PAS domain S-box-containing protein
MSTMYALGDADRFRAVTDSLRDGVVVVDKDGAFRLWNRAATELLAKGPEDIRPSEWAAHYGLYRSDGKTAYSATRFPLVRALRGETVEQERVCVRHCGRPTPVWIDVTATPIVSANGTLDGAVAVFRDVTTKQQASDPEPAVRDADETEEIRRQFLRALSHALRTPLTSIVGYVDLLNALGPDELPATARELVEPIRAGGIKLDAILTDLLDLHQLTSGAGELDPKPTPVRRLIMRVAARVDTGGRPLVIDVPDVTISLDPELIERMLDQLLDNAVRHTPPDTQITVQVRRVRTGVILVVEDTGPGLPDDVRSFIFDAFRHGDPEDGAPGLGLGLTLVRHYAELHGGEVWIEEVRGGTGARFVVRLPES